MRGEPIPIPHAPSPLEGLLSPLKGKETHSSRPFIPMRFSPSRNALVRLEFYEDKILALFFVHKKRFDGSYFHALITPDA